MSSDARHPLISFVIPTVRYTKLLDQTIASAVALSHLDSEVVVNCNPWSDEFLQSDYRQHSSVKWEKVSGARLPISASVNDAVSKSRGRWILILPDDDLLKPDFLQQLDLSTLSERMLITYGIDVIDMEGKVLTEGNRRPEGQMSHAASVEAFCDWQFWHQLALFVFSRPLWDEVGGLEPLGFPNGYYEDTVHHARLVAASDGVLNIDRVLFTRRISTAQESATMYTDSKIVTAALRRVADALVALPHIGPCLLQKHGDSASFFRFLLRQRLEIDLSKLVRDYHAGRLAMLRHAWAAKSWGLDLRSIARAWRAVRR